MCSATPTYPPAPASTTTRRRALTTSRLLRVIVGAATLALGGGAGAQTISAFAGGGTLTDDGVLATEARLSNPESIAVDVAGNVYVADVGAFTVRRIDATTGIITTIAGNGQFGTSPDGGLATESMLLYPSGMAFDAAGNVYIVDRFDHRVHRVNLVTGVITTVAGDGYALFDTSGTNGDQGPAVDASLAFPMDVAVDGAGNLYIADTNAFAVRRVDAQTGIITTIAGSINNAGFSGDGGPAVDAGFNGVTRVAADAAGNVYVLDPFLVENEPGSHARVRRIDATTGIITTVAGGGGGDGESGPATAAKLFDFSMADIALDSAGNLYIAGGERVWRVDPAGLISRFAGAGGGGGASSGDGGPALLATFGIIGGLDVAATGEVYITELFDRVRRVAAAGGPPPADVIVDDATSQLTLDGLVNVAGCVIADGTARPTLVIPNLVSIGDCLTITGNLLLTDIDLATGGGIGGTVTISDNPSATDIDLGTGGGVGGGITISDNPSATDIDLVTGGGVGGGITISDNSSATDINLAVGGGIGSDVTIAGNASAETMTLTVGGGISGDATVAGNTSAEIVDLTVGGGISGDVAIAGHPSAAAIKFAARSVGGTVTVSGNTAQTLDLTVDELVGGDVLLIGNDIGASATVTTGTVGGDVLIIASDIGGSATVTTGTVGGDVLITGSDIGGSATVTTATVGGDVTVSDNAGAANIDLDISSGIGGSVTISDNTSAANIDLDVSSGIGGSVTISDNTSAANVDIDLIGGVGGDVTVSDNTAATTVDVGSLTSAGDVTITNNTSATEVDVGALTTAGTVTISGNTSATEVDIGALATAAGDVIVTDNGTAAVAIGSLSVAGDLIVSTDGQATVDVSGATVAGDESIVTNEAESVSAGTGGGTTTVTLANGAATMTAALPAGAFASRALFTVTSVPAPALTPSQGSDAASIPVLVEPVAAYQFAFDIATLNQPATLTFDIEIAALDAAGQSALLAALASDSLTLAVRGDAPGSAFQTFALCNGQLPSAGGCADVARLDASGNVILPGDATVPTTVRVTGVAGSFSTYAVAIATQIPDTTPPVIADVPAPITAEAASAAGAAVTYSAPTALDDYDGVVAVGCMPASGSLFSLGSTTVTCVAVDAASNGSSSSFTVTVVDTTPPALTCPANQTLTATSASGAIATYPPATVADAVDTAPAVTYSRASGALFPVGATSVTATATDAASNSSTCAFTVTVEPPAPVGADLSLTSAVSPDPATLGSPVTYNVTVRNHGPDEATDVRMAHVLLANVRFVSATSSQGQCLGILSVVACDLDTLGSGATVTVTIVVIPRARGTLTGAAYGLSAVTDPNLANNWAAATTRVR